MPLTTEALQKLTRNGYEPAGCGRELLDRFVGEQRFLVESHGAANTFGGGHDRGALSKCQAVSILTLLAEEYRSKPARQRIVSPEYQAPPTRPLSYTEPATSRKRPHEVFAANSSIIQCAEDGWLLSDSNQNRPDNTHDGGEQTEKVDGRRTKDFQKRNRHKMRAPSPAQKLAPPPEKKKAKTASRKKEKKGDTRIPKNRTDALMEQFSANNIANPRITVWSKSTLADVILTDGSSTLPIDSGSSKKGVKLGILVVVSLTFHPRVQ